MKLVRALITLIRKSGGPGLDLRKCGEGLYTLYVIVKVSFDDG